MFVPSNEWANVERGLRRLGFSSYREFLLSDLWTITRRRLGQRRCESCGRAGRMHLHHMTYARLGAETMEDVCTLCGRCHRRVHREALRGGSLYPEAVMEHRRARPAQARSIGALDVSCPYCGALAGHHCRSSTGRVCFPEHKLRRQAADASMKSRSSSRRARTDRKRARSSKMSVAQLVAIREARDAEFPLESLRANVGRLAR